MTKNNVKKVISEIKEIGNPEIANHSQRFFKTGKGEYGEGDKFLGIRVPQIRKFVAKYHTLEIKEIVEILHSEYHELRLFALLTLVKKFSKCKDEICKKGIFDTYLDNTKYINNWDLIDTTAPQIIGGYLMNKGRNILYKFAKSDNLWERRISIISTFQFIKANDFGDTLKISEILLNDSHDLIHKAVGWMLREVGNRSISTEEEFLKKYYKNMPRTMLRYAIEKFPEEKRKAYLLGKI
ncbi:MAG: DNA alkylation repair protein [Ignavibacteria bacterium]|nr:MAG: DNA alkylation repair protein [Ignavibacteria bacterium]